MIDTYGNRVVLEDRAGVEAVERHSDRLFLSFFLSLVALYCCWVFSLPLFPTQDGAVHLYYAHVFAELRAGSPLFSQFFFIRHPMPPYALHYYLLLLLTKFMGALMAEKCVVCLIILGFTFGFRFLARTVGRFGDLVSIWAVPLSLNWTVAMGFHNYCLALAVALWAIGVWLRAVRRRSIALWAVFLGLVVVMLLTHPVPLLIVLAFVAFELLVRIVQTFRTNDVTSGVVRRLLPFRSDLIVAALAFASLLYIVLFVDRHRTAQNLHSDFLQRDMLFDFLHLRPLSLIGGVFLSRIYRLALYGMLVGFGWIGAGGLRRSWKEGRIRSADLLFIATLVLGIAAPLLPRSINGSDFFSDRLLILVWVGAVAAASRSIDWPMGMRRILGFAGVALALFALFIANRYLRPVANRLAVMEHAPLAAIGPRGMFIDQAKGPSADNLTFNPYVWSAARYFRRTNTVMLDAPWLDLPILPIGARGNLFTNIIPPEIHNYPERFSKLLLDSQGTRDRLSPFIDFVLLVGFPDGSQGSGLDKVLEQPWPAKWSCKSTDWFSVCSPDHPMSR